MKLNPFTSTPSNFRPSLAGAGSPETEKSSAVPVDSVAEPRYARESPMEKGMGIGMIAIPTVAGLTVGVNVGRSYGPAAGVAAGLATAVLAAPVGIVTGLLFGAISGSF